MTSSARIELSRVRQIPAHELVVEQIRRALELGRFMPGDKLPTERELSEMLDVSRTVVRAAMTILDREGLVSVKRGRNGGVTVASPQRDDAATRRSMRENRVSLGNAFDYRVIVESAAARMAAERRRTADVTQLRKLLSAMAAQIARAQKGEASPQLNTEWLSLDSAFHLKIAESCRNDYLFDAVANARRTMWLPVGAIFHHIEPNANDFHDAIIDAIEDRNGDLAAATMTEHINTTRHTLESWLRQR
ncbi:FadR family transcriptional regulator [Mycolicibacterium sp. P9-64]|uniref:FadR/GntR family transcriptional regulator n=1 Tax=Mycolicibacterium sp. P9-64 TaxID=2024612 RepID=UPI0011EC9F51|nr:FCD domain-containing protein [Mycolicibacterium sp. P9-64]KAA0078858.1 FadR family transcriptional regulator [Mycolicibacterium sp. P9-64]